jgi:DNA-directed RNA polymerase subunit RPC12/RpoP
VALKGESELSVTCPYCNIEAIMTDGEDIYPHRSDLWKKKFYKCGQCGAYVGCHPNSTRPLGRLANAELRKAKSVAHLAFDKLWRDGPLSRSVAYAWLSGAMGIPESECHIGMFDVDQCNAVVQIMKERDAANV